MLSITQKQCYAERVRRWRAADAQEAIPGLPKDVVVEHILRSLADPIDLAQIRVVSISMCKAVAATGRKIEEMSEEQAVRLGCLSSVRRLYRIGRLKTVSLRAALFGHLEMLKWARANGALMDVWAWNSQLCASAAEGGHLEMLKWLCKKDCAWNVSTCSRAAEGGHFEMVKWAHLNGCPWDNWTCMEAAEGRHLQVLQWARANGCPWHEEACTAAAEGGHVEVLKWLCANGCHWSLETYFSAEQFWQYDVLDWMLLNGIRDLDGFFEAFGGEMSDDDE